MENSIEITNIVKRFNGSHKNAIDGISLSIRKGEKFGFFGPNGAGKTTLISLLCSIIQPTEGRIDYLFGEEHVSTKVFLNSIGFVPQDFAFYPELTLQQNLKYFGRLYRIPEAELTEKINFLIHALGLEHVRKRKVNTFSGGMKRRVNLGIGLINNPKVLFLDEPTVGVDVQSKVAIIDLLNELNANGTTIIYTSHHLKEAEDFCDRIALLDHGKIIALDALPTLLKSNNVNNLEELLIQLTGNQLRD